MNSFNIRELESALKKKFFTDLVNSSDHRKFINLTMLSARYKTNNISSTSQNITIFYNYGTLLHSSSKNVNLQNNLDVSSFFDRIRYIISLISITKIDILILNIFDYLV
jgi:oligoribonuclease NrnB/cAMP/cGMP phosphodiesterase (DHH superfamily)